MESAGLPRACRLRGFEREPAHLVGCRSQSHTRYQRWCPQSARASRRDTIRRADADAGPGRRVRAAAAAVLGLAAAHGRAAFGPARQARAGAALGAFPRRCAVGAAVRLHLAPAPPRLRRRAGRPRPRPAGQPARARQCRSLRCGRGAVLFRRRPDHADEQSRAVPAGAAPDLQDQCAAEPRRRGRLVAGAVRPRRISPASDAAKSRSRTDTRAAGAAFRPGTKARRSRSRSHRAGRRRRRRGHAEHGPRCVVRPPHRSHQPRDRQALRSGLRRAAGNCNRALRSFPQRAARGRGARSPRRGPLLPASAARPVTATPGRQGRGCPHASRAARPGAAPGRGARGLRRQGRD